MNAYHPFFGAFIGPVYEFAAKKFAGFPQWTKRDELLYSSERVARLNWTSFRAHLEGPLRDMPTFLAYAENGKIITYLYSYPWIQIERWILPFFAY